MPELPSQVAVKPEPGLRRVLTLWDLVFCGIVLIQPIAPVPLYGVAQKLSGGHFALIILIAMFAMMITAVSYGRMAALYPAAGSAYTYVGKGLNLHLGFLAGWAMFLEHAGELLNFGAFMAFMGVNLATFWQFTVVPDSKYKRRVLSDIILPLTGFVFCALIWWGLIYAAVKTRGFRAGPVMIDFTES
jgi:amino acid transporter